jgi:hypothetical protein
MPRHSTADFAVARRGGSAPARPERESTGRNLSRSDAWYRARARRRAAERRRERELGLDMNDAAGRWLARHER